MANTYSQISIHAVFAVNHRDAIITKAWRDNLHSYISGILEQDGMKPLAVGGWLDHVHVFFGMPVSKSISQVMQVLKANSSKWVNENDFLKTKFQWQEGFGAFSYARSQRDTVIKYIMNQEEHHKKETFKKEYLKMLEKFEVKYDEKYLFEFFE
jgi:REP element-mobilizing transposase RayT